MRFLTTVATTLCTLTLAAQTNQFLGESHRFYIEPDMAYGLIKDGLVEDLVVKESRFLVGFNLGYEFLKPNAFYAGAEASFSVGNCFADLYEDHIHVAQGEAKMFQNKLETDFGYTLEGADLFLTPFTGLGGYFLFHENAQFNLAYIPLGIRGEYRTSNISVGLKAVQLHYVHVWEKYENSKFSANIFGNSFYGYEISFPISFQMDLSEKQWYATFEPYYLKLNDVVSYLGGRIAGMYNF